MSKILFLSIFLVFFLVLPLHAHMDVWLKNEAGDRITPTNGSIDPYSPRQTCGGCHDYRLITSGYHFTQGFESISDNFDPKRPWILSPGMFGRWVPTAAVGRISPKTNKNPLLMDLTTYDWIGRGGRYTREGKLISSACGFCHPGGGPMEYGRTRNGRPDFSRNLITGEEDKWPAYDGDYSSLDTPHGKSLFRVSGVVEADCLICHLRNYDMRERNIQLSKRNYRWAATAGAKLGIVEGAIFIPARLEGEPSDPDFYKGYWNLEKRPVVRYRWSDRNLFTSEGRLKGSIISKAVATANCLQCHDLGERKNTGTVMAAGYDVHLKRGFNCTDCHGLIGSTKKERLSHQIAKGHSPINTVRDDLDGKEMKTCTECHLEGKYKQTRPNVALKAPNPYPTHSRVFSGYRFHTYLIDCMACHAPTRSGKALLLLDMSLGHEASYTAEGWERLKGESDYLLTTSKPWSPWMRRTIRYEPVVPKWLVWFGNETKDGIYPIPLRYVALAAKGLKVRKERPFMVNENDVTQMLNRLKKMGYGDAVYVADRVYGTSGNKIKALSPPVKTIYYPIVHGIEGKKALRECQSCHGAKAPFFTRMEIVNLREFLTSDYPEMKEPNCQPQFKIWGMKNVPSGR